MQKNLFVSELRFLPTLAAGVILVLLYLIFDSFRASPVNEKKIVFLGRQPYYEPSDEEKVRLKKDHDQFHLEALRYYVGQLKDLPNDANFTFEYRYNSEDHERSQEIYNSIAKDDSVVLVVDNTWGQELQESASVIRENAIPVISLNADKGGKDFGNGAVFLGADDDTPESLVSFLLYVLNMNEVIFITEEHYKLRTVFEEVLKQAGVTVLGPVVLPGNKPVPGGVSEALEKLSPYLEGQDLRRRPILLNVHGDWGSKLINRLDESFSGLTILAGGSAVNEKFDSAFGKEHKDNQFFVLFSTSEDSVSEGVYDGLKRFRRSFREYIDSRNAALFLERVQNAASLIRYAIDNQVEKEQAQIELRKLKEEREERRQDEEEEERAVDEKPKEISRGTFLNYFSGVATECIEADYDLIEFDKNFIQKREVNFVRYQNGEANSYMVQLNTRGSRIPNIRMGIQVNNIFDIDLREGEFGVDFFYWTEARKDSGEEDRDGGNIKRLYDKPIIFRNLKELTFMDSPIEIHRGEEIYKLYRVSGRFYTQFNIRDYPLDQQHLRLEAEVINPTELVRLSFDRESLQQAQVASGAVKVDEWNIEEFYVTVDNKLSDSSYGRKFSERCSQKFKHLTTHIVVKRNFLDSLLTVVIPLILIGVVAIAVLLVNDLSFHAVGNVAVGIFLGLIAFLIALTDIAPDLSQISRAGVLFWATFSVVISVILVLVLVNSGIGTETLRLKISRYARFVIPALYLLAIILTPLL